MTEFWKVNTDFLFCEDGQDLAGGHVLGMPVPPSSRGLAGPYGTRHKARSAGKSEKEGAHEGGARITTRS